MAKIRKDWLGYRMSKFNYEQALSKLMTPEVMSAIGSIREYRGKQTQYVSVKSDVLNKLCEVAKIQSTSSSNRIENISTSDERLRKLVEQKIEPINRDEREIAGYRYVLDMIHQSHDDISITPNVILQLHRDLYRFQDVSFAGNWKDTDNIIAERAEDGTMIARFIPTSAVETPYAIQQICEEYDHEVRAGIYDPLLISLLFVFDFVCIHPFNDGNGRMSRLITLLLTYQCGYTVGKYVSIEAEIEKTRVTYYEALAASSIGWNTGENDYLPFVTYMLGVIGSCCRTLEERLLLFSTNANNEDILRTYFDTMLGAVTKRQIMDDNPVMSQHTVERILQKLQREGYLEKVGAARSTAYRKAR